jgi:indole-3-glycerol phosphate synthase
MASDFLSKILDHKQMEVDAARRKVPEKELKQMAQPERKRRPFFKQLATPGRYGTNVIAEIKRGSPSKGIIRDDLDPASYAKMYETGGAAAISVLTDSEYFRGSPDDLKKARAATRLPVLRKDFLISPYQIYEAAAMGADAVLLIVRALSRELLRDGLSLCRELHLDALVEVHSEEELEVASWAGARLIGINNRDLTTFRTDLQTSIRIARYLEGAQVAVAESGIRERADIERLQAEAGIHNFLIGESLVRAPDPIHLLEDLLGCNRESREGADHG